MTALSALAAGREAPAAPALIVGGQIHSWLEVAGRVAALLPDLPDGDGPVPLLGVARLEVALGLLALIEAGRTALVLHPRLPPAETQALLERLALSQPWSPPLPSPQPIGPALAPLPEDRPLAWLGTSGSTGAPKVVQLSRRAFLASAQAHAANLPFQPGDRWLLAMPLGHVGGLSVLVRCLVARAAVAWDPPPPGAAHRPFSPADVVYRMFRDEITLLSVVPSQLQDLLPLGPPPPSLRAVLVGGAAAPPALLARAWDAGWPVLATYGLTEACSQVCTWRPGTRPDPAEGVGPPLPGVAVRTVDAEIQVRGPMLLDRLLPAGAHPSPWTADGWLRTGDLGHQDAQGRLHVTGRRSELIITGGENVSPGAVEAQLLACPGVVGGVVFGVPDPRYGERVAAALVLEGVALAEVQRWARETVAPHARPRGWAVLDALPLGATGKVDRAAVARLAGPLLQSD